MCGAASALREKERESKGVGYTTSIGLSRPPSLSLASLGSRGFLISKDFFAARARGFSEFPARAAALHLRRPAGRLEKKPAVPGLSLSFLPRADWLYCLSPTLLEPGMGGRRARWSGEAKAVKEGWRRWLGVSDERAVCRRNTKLSSSSPFPDTMHNLCITHTIN